MIYGLIVATVKVIASLMTCGYPTFVVTGTLGLVTLYHSKTFPNRYTLGKIITYLYIASWLLTLPLNRFYCWPLFCVFYLSHKYRQLEYMSTVWETTTNLVYKG